jgi:hypothetical protein
MRPNPSPYTRREREDARRAFRSCNWKDGEYPMRNILFAAAAAAAVAATPAIAQVSNQGGLVNVDVSNVLNNLDLLNNTLNNNTVQVPVGVAAAVCGVDANVLAHQRKGNSPVTCTAKNTSQALKQAAKKQAVPKQ